MSYRMRRREDKRVYDGKPSILADDSNCATIETRAVPQTRGPADALLYFFHMSSHSTHPAITPVQPPTQSLSQPPAHLGQKPGLLSASQIEQPVTILDTFPNPRPARDYQVKFIFPEFTSICPVTGQPDFATITISYTPDQKCVEMKSLKLYFLAYRNKGIFYEGVVNTILDDLVSKLSPRHMTIVGEFNARGGTVGVITATHNS